MSLGNHFNQNLPNFNWENDENYILDKISTSRDSSISNEGTSDSSQNISKSKVEYQDSLARGTQISKTNFEDHLKNHFKGHFFLKTSGSTGTPKWVALSKKAILASAKAVNLHLEVSENDSWFLTIPYYHIGGLSILARAYLGKNQVMANPLPHWKPIEFYEELKNSQASLTSLVPTQVFDLVKNGIQAPGKLRAVLVGGGSLSEDLYFKARELSWPLLPTYGFTEFASQVATASLKSLVSKNVYPELQVLPHAVVSNNENQRLLITGDSLFTAYVFEGIEVKVEFSKDLHFQSEDLVSIEESKLYKNKKIIIPLGRADHNKKVNGKLVNVFHLNHQFKTQFGEESGELIFINDERSENQIVLITEKSNISNTEKQVQEFNKNQGPSTKIRGIYFLKQIPRTPLGKVYLPAILALLVTRPPSKTV